MDPTRNPEVTEPIDASDLDMGSYKDYSEEEEDVAPETSEKWTTVASDHLTMPSGSDHLTMPPGAGTAAGWMRAGGASEELRNTDSIELVEEDDDDEGEGKGIDSPSGK